MTGENRPRQRTRRYGRTSTDTGVHPTGCAGGAGTCRADTNAQTSGPSRAGYASHGPEAISGRGTFRDELTDPRIAEMARKLQLARHARALTQQVETLQGQEAVDFGEEEEATVHVDLRKRTKFETLECTDGSPTKVLTWTKAFSDYFDAVPMPEKEKVDLAMHHTSRLARAWWDARKLDGKLGKKLPVKSWEVLKAELLDRFLPEDYTARARCYAAFYEVRPDGQKLADFHIRFIEASLKLPDLSEQAKLARYCDVVKPEYARAIKQQRCKTVDEAMRATMDIERYSIRAEAACPKTGLQWKAKTIAAVQNPSVPPAPVKPVTFRRHMEAERMELRKHNKCFICAEGGHIARSCPYKAQYSRWVQDQKNARQGIQVPAVEGIKRTTSVLIQEIPEGATGQEEGSRKKPRMAREINALTRRARAQADNLEFPLRTRCVKVTRQLGGNDVVILIDGGSNYIYVRAEVALKAKVQWYANVEEEVVTLANGSMETAEVCHIEGQLAFQGYSDTIHLNVVDALVHDVLLGQDWLHDVDGVMYHRRHTMKMVHEGQKLVIESMDYVPDAKVYSAKHAMRAFKADDVEYAAVLCCCKGREPVIAAETTGPGDGRL